MNNENKFQQPPNNDPPALIKYFFGSRTHVGEINIGSFYLTLLDLINRKYVSVQIVSKKNKNPKKYDEDNYWKKSVSKPAKTLDKIILKINRQSVANLHPFEKNVLRCIYALK